jgi:hypothetical protein
MQITSMSFGNNILQILTDNNNYLSGSFIADTVFIIFIFSATGEEAILFIGLQQKDSLRENIPLINSMQHLEMS